MLEKTGIIQYRAEKKEKNRSFHRNKRIVSLTEAIYNNFRQNHVIMML